MLKDYNPTQKATFIIAVIVFIVANILSVLIVIDKSTPPAVLSSSDIQLRTSNQDKLTSRTFNIGQDITSEIGYSEVSASDALILVNSGFNLKFSSSNSIEVFSGTFLIIPKNILKLDFKGVSLNLNSSGKYILNSSEKSLVVLSGTLNINGNELKANTKVDLSSGSLDSSPFNREDLANEEPLRELVLVANVFKEDIPELTDTIPPRLISISPGDNFQSSTSIVRINGKTEQESIVFIDNQEAEVDNLGNFSKSIVLEEGRNEVIVSLIDKFGNKSTVELNYFYRN